MPTQLIPEALARDLTATLARLRIARNLGDKHETQVCENQLNRLIERIPRPQEIA